MFKYGLKNLIFMVFLVSLACGSQSGNTQPQQQVIVVTATPNNQSEASQPQESSQEPQSQGTTSNTTARFKDFAFELQACTNSSGYVECEFIVTNLGEDNRVSIEGSTNYNATMLFDNLGNQYEGIEAHLANQSSNWSAKSTLISGIPTNGKVAFENVSSEANNIALLQIGGRVETGNNSGRFKIEFREVPLVTK